MLGAEIVKNFKKSRGRKQKKITVYTPILPSKMIANLSKNLSDRFSFLLNKYTKETNKAEKHKLTLEILKIENANKLSLEQTIAISDMRMEDYRQVKTFRY